MTDSTVSEKAIEVQRHGTMYLVSSLGITCIGFLATIFYAHWVGAAVLGAYFLFLSSLNMIGLFGDFGIQNAATHRICCGKDPDEYFTANIFMHISIYFLLVTVLILLKDYYPALNQNGFFWLLILVMGISLITSMIGMGIGASNRLGLAASVSLLNNATKIIFQILFVFLGFQVYGLIGGLIAGLLIELLIDLRFVNYHLKKFNISHIKSLYSYSSWAYLVGNCTIVFDNLNPIIIAYFLSENEVGIFGVCWTFSVFALFVSTALCNTLFVKVSRWNASGEVQAIAVSLKRATTYSLVLALPMFAGGLIVGKPLLYYLYGASFAAGATTLIIIIGLRVVQSIFQLYSNFLMAIDHVKQAFYGIFLGTCLNVVLAILLVPVFGLNGAAIASLVNVIISTIILRYYLKQIMPINIERSPIWHIITATGVMTAALLIIDMIPIDKSATITISTVIVCSIIYFIVLLTLDPPIRDDILRTLKIQWIPQ